MSDTQMFNIDPIIITGKYEQDNIYYLTTIETEYDDNKVVIHKIKWEIHENTIEMLKCALSKCIMAKDMSNIRKITLINDVLITKKSE